MKTLITYFSAQGTTAKVAKELAAMTGADIFEIRPEKPYTAADLKWTNPLARCNREMLGRRDVPVEGRITDFDQYDTILIGFPIWYGAAPNVINTFCKGYPWDGKRVFAFATSGGSGIGGREARTQLGGSEGLGQAVNFFVFPADTIENQRAQAYNGKRKLT